MLNRAWDTRQREPLNYWRHNSGCGSGRSAEVRVAVPTCRMTLIHAVDFECPVVVRFSHGVGEKAEQYRHSKSHDES